MWVAHIEVKDDDEYAEYIKGSGRVVAAYDGQFLRPRRRPEPFHPRDDGWLPSRTVP
jgi:uncharacterized protein (DUF1330 family)